MKTSPLIVIFLTVFIDLLGFGIIIPLSPYLAKQFNASGFEIGLLMAVYSIMQFLFSPYWGSLSDRIGRRPVIMIGLLGGAASYLLFAFAQSLSLLFVARALAGVFGGNISTAHAYIADVTDAKDRSKGMGLLGAAFGLGFIFGPLIGGLLGHWGQSLGSAPPFGISFSAIGAAVLCLGNFLFACFVLKESLPPEKRRLPSHGRVARLRTTWLHLQKPIVGPMILVFFLSGLAMAQMEAMLFNYMADEFAWDLKTASYGFAYIGVIMVITQGYLIRKWMPRLGEPRILIIGLSMFAFSLIGIALAQNIYLLAIVMTILAFGNGMMRPPNLGIVSLLTSAQEQGAVMGVTNSLASLGRIIGPIAAGYLYDQLNHGAPFVLAGFIAVLALVLTLRQSSLLPSSGQKAGHHANR